ncbi:MAG: hypothetical protein H3Z52_11090 [archaeon]|nr:hypothetical protein [archaeon]MCP8315853.1 hypothetical protein [archaeon]MCP8321465.1 hypothetical protein [archaeon]
MGKVITGIKAGVVSGAIYGIILAPFTYLTLIFLKEDIMAMLIASLPPGSSITPEYGVTYYLYGSGEGLITSFIFGLLLGYFYNRFTPKTVG